jgi:hypothetical protein
MTLLPLPRAPPSCLPADPPKEVTFKEPGNYTWTPPESVKSVSVVCIGGGGGAGSYKSKTFVGSAAGGGGEGAWRGVAQGT